ncbi:hypothetical protein ACIA3K_03520 [Micromonospora sp. NPDC051543]|uniref:hypothetical protein n=1 Tax=Micromonospora sp. NPDC051543 TaxID=3364287 RepID=UPI0037BA69D2
MDNTWQSIDDMIVRGRLIVAIQAIRQAEECSLQRTIDLFTQRGELLRRTRPHDFQDPATTTGMASTVQ